MATDDPLDELLTKLSLRDALNAEEIEALRYCIVSTQTVPADHVLVHEGEVINVSTLLVEGLVCRFKDLRDGGRQISAVHVAGDFVDLHGFLLKRLDHSIASLTPCSLAFASHERLREITERLPHLARMLWLSTTIDAAMHREWVTSLGQRDALERSAHLFCELGVRMQAVGLAQEDSYPLPLTQQELAQCLGITPVHVNRTLKELRERGLLTFRNGQVCILDRKELEAQAEFDPAYLYMERRAR